MKAHEQEIVSLDKEKQELMKVIQLLNQKEKELKEVIEKMKKKQQEKLFSSTSFHSGSGSSSSLSGSSSLNTSQLDPLTKVNLFSDCENHV